MPRRRKNSGDYYDNRDIEYMDSAAFGRQSENRRGRKKRSAAQTLLGLFITFVLLVAVCIAGVILLSRYSQSGNVSSQKADMEVSLNDLYSPYAVLIEADNCAVIGEKNSNERIYPASMTKILSVLEAIESIRDLNKKVTISEDFYDNLYDSDASRAGFEPGETTTVNDLLYGALLPSGAECCMQLAIEAAGSEEGLVQKMNNKVNRLGLTGTNFVNCTGLHDSEQYTTVYEMALILKEAVSNETFRNVFTSHYHVMDPTEVHPDGFTVWSTFFKSIEDDSVTGGKILGAKTGYTEEAGLCLASLAEIGGKDYILVTAGWCSEEDIDAYHITDAFTAYNRLGEALGY